MFFLGGRDGNSGFVVVLVCRRDTSVRCLLFVKLVIETFPGILVGYLAFQSKLTISFSKRDDGLFMQFGLGFFLKKKKIIRFFAVFGDSKYACWF